MQLKTAIKQVEALRYVVSELNLQSGLGRRTLLESLFMTDRAAIEKELDAVEKTQELLLNPQLASFFDAVVRKIAQVKDIRNTIIRLSNNAVMDDIELFELKHLCVLSDETRRLAEKEGIEILRLPDISFSLHILDPDGLRLPNFYIYDAYSEKLAALRKELKAERATLERLSPDDAATYKVQEEKADALYQKSLEEEDKIRFKLSKQLSLQWGTLLSTLEAMARLDILIAKAEQSLLMSFVKPSVAENATVYKGIFHPQLKPVLEREGKHFQPVDIVLKKTPCLITGANMAGKTVLLKSLQTAQYLFQFGFFVPACEAQIGLVDDVLVSMGDEQAELRGLSSFAAEILTMDEIVKIVDSGKNVLVLIDELARTTNPVEGAAIVNGMLEFLYENNVRSVVTTHYSGIAAPCKKLRVKGFIETNVNAPLTKENIGDFIDYSLEEEHEEQVPMEALKVAKALGVDEGLLRKTKKYLNNG